MILDYGPNADKSFGNSPAGIFGMHGACTGCITQHQNRIECEKKNTEEGSIREVSPACVKNFEIFLLNCDNGKSTVTIIQELKLYSATNHTSCTIYLRDKY